MQGQPVTRPEALDGLPLQGLARSRGVSDYGRVGEDRTGAAGANRRRLTVPQAAEEEPERAEPHPAMGGAQESTWRLWWRRLIGA